jgi:murein L,D-transpeptidase YcbB/YkuD
MKRGLVALALPALVLGACKNTKISRGEVSAEWSNKALTEVRDVPVFEVRRAIGQRLTEKRPTALSEDTWGHVNRLYKQFGDGPLFLDKDGLDSDRVNGLLRALVAADKDALRLDAYRLGDVARAIDEARKAAKPTAEQLAEADVLLASAFAALGEDLLIGQVNPRTVTDDWHIPAKDEAVDSALARSLREEALEDAIRRMRPQDEDYAALQKELVRYREIVKKGGWQKVPAGEKLKPGDPAPAARLAALRARLAAEGIEVPASPSAPVSNPPDGSASPGQAVYDAGLAGAVARFQSLHGIVVDSVLGPGTVESMNVSADYRLTQIAGNLERFRWLPRSLGERYVIVNVPAFRVQAFDSANKVLEMKVIVGSEFEGRSTPVFADSMTHVVFRPYWNITPEIQAKEIEPKIAQDPGYMARNQYEWWNDGGKRRIRQLPGPKNSLGLVKFMFPNSFNIYLHDTPEDALFEKDVRAFSHGCIRLEKPDEFAQWVLGWDAGRVQEAMNEGKDNRTYNLERKIPVYIVYFTAHIRDGQLAFGPDIYNRDEALVAKMTGASGQTVQSIAAVSALSRLAGD